MVLPNRLRVRYSDDVPAAIKGVALEQLAAGGPAAVSINAIGRELGVSGPALYRYVSGWDELITLLIIDGYRDLTAAMSASLASRRTPRTRLAACTKAYRAWALDHPAHYRLLLQAPRPGFSFTDPRVVEASQGAMNVLIDVIGTAAGPRLARDPVGIGGWLTVRGLPASATAAGDLAVRLWARLHGLVSLEIDGCFAAMGLHADALYEQEIALPGIRG